MLKPYLTNFLIVITLLFANKVVVGNELLFSEVTPKSLPPQTSQSMNNIYRERLVKINYSLLTNSSNEMKQSPNQKKVILFNLFHDVQLDVYPTKIETPNSGKTKIWHGQIKGMKNSSVTVAITDDVAMGTIRTQKGDLYQIKYVANGVHAIQHVNQSMFPPDLPPLTKPPQIK